MLLSELRKDTLPIGKVQFVLAIIIGDKAGAALEGEALKISTSTLRYYVEEKQKQTKGNVDIVRTVIECVATQPVISQGRRQCNIYEYGRYGNTRSSLCISEEELYKAVMRVLRDYSNERCLSLFADSPYAKEKVLKAIKNNYVAFTGDVNPTPAKLNAIFNDLKDKQINRYSSDYVFSSNHDNPVGWLIKALEFFSKNRTFYTNRANERNQDQIIGSDRGSTQMELVAMENRKEKINIDFPSVVSDIALASQLLYVHKNNTEAYSDIYTHYVNKKANEVREAIFRSLGTKASLYSIVNRWDPVIVGASHVNNKKNSRDNIAKVMEMLVDNPIAVSEVSKLYKKVLQVNENIRLNREGTIKDGMRLFDSKDVSVRSKMRNGERFEILYKGYVALANFIRYLNSRDISLFSIPTEIFRNIKLPRRFYSLDEYLKLGSTVAQLVQDVDRDAERSKQVVNGMWNNDALFDSISLQLSGEAATIQNFLRNSCTLGDIKTAIDNVERRKKCAAFDQQAFVLYEKYKPEMSYFMIGVIGDKAAGKRSVTLLDRQEEMDAFKQRSDSIQKSHGDAYRIYKFPFYPGAEDYVSYTDPFSVGMDSAEARKDFIGKYRNCLNWVEASIINTGTFEQQSLGTLRGLHFYFMLAIYNFDSYKNLTENKERVRMKLSRCYVHLLEALMEKEGHPVKRNHLYAIRGRSIADQFSYLLEGCDTEEKEKSALREIKYREFAISFCADALLAHPARNDWEKLRDLFISVSVYEKLWLNLLNALVTICNAKREFLTDAELDKKLHSMNEYRKFMNDGAFGALVRSTAFSNLYKLNKPIMSINDIPFLWEIDTYSVVENDAFYANAGKHGNTVIVDTVNKFINRYPDIFEYFRILDEQISIQIRPGLEHAAFNAGTDAECGVLEEAARSLRETKDFIKRFGNSHTGKISAMLHTAVCDKDGYLMLFNKRYSVDTADSLNYVHNSGFWVRVKGNKFSLTPIGKIDYDHLKGILK